MRVSKSLLYGTKHGGKTKMKSKTTALILSVLVGGLGIDRFYLGYTGLGVLKLLTGGCFGILWIIDIINIATGKLLPADGSQYEDSTTSTSASTPSVYEELEKLSALHEKHVLTDEEYEKLRKELLAKL